MNRDVIKFRKNTPVTVKLDRGPEGKLHTSGDYQYVVNDNAGIMFLPPAARVHLQRTHAAAGDEVAITKMADDSWRCEVLSDARTDYSEPLKQSIHQVQQQRQPTNGATALAPRNQPVQQPVQQLGTHDLLARFFVLAGRALRMAHQQLGTEGIEIEPFNWEDVRASGISLFIEHNRGQR
jgi:hypothetical protein